MWIHVIGARPNFPKFAPIYLELQRADQRQLILHTGQHYDELMSDVFLRDLGISDVDINIGVGSGRQAQQTAQMMMGIDDYLQNKQDCCVVVYGDTNSTLAAALVAAKSRIPLVHVESGLRSFDFEMPEEINRRIVDSVSDLLLTTSPEAESNLISEGIEASRIVFVGNTMIDSLRRAEPLLSSSHPFLTDWIDRSFILVTLHRPSNVDDVSRVAEISGALARLSIDTPVVFPVHPRSRLFLESTLLQSNQNVHLIDPMPYVDFLTILKHARAVITDSGGVQEESTAFGIPCFTLRDNTERPVTISHGSNQLVTLAQLEREVRRKMELDGSDVKPFVPPLWDGRASTRAVDAMLSWIRSQQPSASLGSHEDGVLRSSSPDEPR